MYNKIEKVIKIVKEVLIVLIMFSVLVGTSIFVWGMIELIEEVGYMRFIVILCS